MKNSIFRRAIVLSTALAAMLTACSSNSNSQEENITAESGLQIESEEATDIHEGNNAFEPLIVEEGNYGGVYEQDKTDISYRVRYQAVILDEGTRKIYPELAETLVKDKDDFFKYATESMELYRESSEGGIYSNMEMIDEYDVSVLRADQNVLSLRREGFWYSGGAHGESSIEGICYDSRTGRRLELKDVISDSDLLIRIAGEKLKETYGSELDFNDRFEPAIRIAMGEQEAEYSSGVSFALSYNYMELYFDTYTLGSHADGRQIIKLEYSQYPGLVREEFIKAVPKAYAYKLDNYDELIYEDIDKDGKNERISIDILRDPDSTDAPDMYILNTAIDGNEHRTEFFSYINYETYFVKNADGNSYIYIFASHDNDFTILNVCRLTKDGVILSEAGNFEPGIIKYEYVDWETDFPNSYLTTNNVISYALTDPDYLMLSSRLYALSTYSGCRSYYADSNGLPKSNALYEINTDLVFTLKKDLELEECYSNGKRTGSKLELPAGTELVPYRTDGTSEMIFICGDDRYVIGDIDVDVYPQTINKLPSDEVFDGQVYAG